MGRKKLSMSEKIRRYMANNMGEKPSEVAKALGVDVKLVYYVKYHPKAKAKPAKTNNVSSSDIVMVHHPEPKADIVNHPPHYTDGGIEVIDFLQAKMTREEFIGYLKGNVLKYGSRLGKKGDPGVDAGKMAWYAAKLRDVMAVAS